jgi:hypothetical protein
MIGSLANNLGRFLAILDVSNECLQKKVASQIETIKSPMFKSGELYFKQAQRASKWSWS